MITDDDIITVMDHSKGMEEDYFQRGVKTKMIATKKIEKALKLFNAWALTECHIEGNVAMRRVIKELFGPLAED